MGSHDFAARDLPRLRRGAHEFLRRLAAHAWEHQNEFGRWEITLPPDIAVLPEHRRFRVHAGQEARRLARAQLYDLDAEITGRAVHLGAAIRGGRHEEAVALAGHPRVAVTLGIEPPAPSGFVRWRDGIGYNGLGAPVVACHWGPALGGGRWLAWWADSHAMAAGWAAEAAKASQHIDAGFVTRLFGPLWYDHQELLRPRRAGTRDDSVPEPEAAAADASASGVQAGTPGLALLYTTLATWRLLTCPGDAVHLSQQPSPTAEQAADRAAGLHTGPVTIAAAAWIA
jgi:hypothetical protein